LTPSSAAQGEPLCPRPTSGRTARMANAKHFASNAARVRRLDIIAFCCKDKRPGSSFNTVLAALTPSPSGPQPIRSSPQQHWNAEILICHLSPCCDSPEQFTPLQGFVHHHLSFTLKAFRIPPPSWLFESDRRVCFQNQTKKKVKNAFSEPI